MTLRTGVNVLRIDVSVDFWRYGDAKERRWVEEHAEREMALSTYDALTQLVPDDRQYLVRVSKPTWLPDHSQLRREVTVLLHNWQDAKVGEATVGEPSWDAVRRDRQTMTDARSRQWHFIREHNYWRRVERPWPVFIPIEGRIEPIG